MKRSAAQVLKDAQGLPEGERIRLIEVLLDELDVPADDQDDESFITELERRTREVEDGRARGSTWAQVKRRARAAARVGQ